jgi:phosphoribosylaminoimidazole (AIR) synthetase
MEKTGVDSEDRYKKMVIEPGDQMSELAHRVNEQSYGNSKAIEMIPGLSDWTREPGYVPVPHICRLMAERTDTPQGCHPVMWETQSTDGGGHKPNVIAAVGSVEAFWGLGAEPIIMNDHDILRRGGLPAVMTNFMDIKTVTPENVHLMKAFWGGYAEAAKEAGVVNVTGETAVVRYSVTAFCDHGRKDQLLMNLAGNCMGFHHIDKYISGQDVKPGMPIVGFWEPSSRCNGYTLGIEVGMAVFGCYPQRSTEAMEYFTKLAMRSKSYSKTILRVHGWKNDGTISPALAKMLGIYHITGGGVWNKLKLPKGVGALIDRMIAPAEILLYIQELSKRFPHLYRSDWKCHSTFHGGCGIMTVCATEEDADILVMESGKDGVVAQIIGETTESPQNEIIIHSKFMEGKELSSLRPE